MSKKLLFFIILVLVYLAGLFTKDHLGTAIILAIVAAVLSYKLGIMTENKL